MLEKRKYMLVPYQLSGRQGGIQAGHASDEYSLKYSEDTDNIDFLKNHKTWIVLNGGTTNDREDYKGTINKDVALLVQHNIKHTIFREPDLGDVITAVCLIADERVFKKDIYPDFSFLNYSNWVRKYPELEENNSVDRLKELFEEDKAKAYEKFVEKVGIDIAVLKSILNNKPKF